jgi:hypothetical protein
MSFQKRVAQGGSALNSYLFGSRDTEINLKIGQPNS